MAGTRKGALRVKNVAEGFFTTVNVGGRMVKKFIPIRASGDYDPSRAHVGGTGKHAKETEFQRRMRQYGKPAGRKRNPSFAEAGANAAEYDHRHGGRKRVAGAWKDAIAGIRVWPDAQTAENRRQAFYHGYNTQFKELSQRTRNPVPTKFTKAMVRRLPSGDVQLVFTDR
jgi:hypothetical protein